MGVWWKQQARLVRDVRKVTTVGDLFSWQLGFCAVCGKRIALSVKPGLPSFHTPVCDRVCLAEWRWRETLSIQGVAYYDKPPEAATQGGRR